MLRSFEYFPSLDRILDILEKFDLKVAGEKFPFALLRFEVITPDSFMWRLLVGKTIYYMYAEDFVPSLGHVKSIFDCYLESKNWEFVEPLKRIEFDESSPVTSAVTYKRPEDYDKISRFAAESGHDFVFLAKSNEDPEEAQFSDHAPRGFDNNLVK